MDSCEKVAVGEGFLQSPGSGTQGAADATQAASGTNGEQAGDALQPTDARTAAEQGPAGPKRGPNDTLQFRTDRPGFVESFWSRVAKHPSGCWVWSAARNGLGYGIVWNGEKLLLAHRVAYTLTHGPIPRGVVIDHLCRNVACANPAHLQLVTQRENTLRGKSPTAVAHRNNTCTRGHSMERFYRRPDGRRACRQCNADRARERRATKRASA